MTNKNKNKTTMKKFISSGTMLHTMVNDVLTQVEIKRAIYDKDLCLKNYVAELDGNEIVIEANAKFYRNEVCFKRNDSYEPNAELNIPHLDNDERGWYVGMYAMKDGEPKEVKAYISGVVARHERDYDIDYYEYTSEELYGNYEDCLQNNDYKVKLEDGTEVVRTGLAKLVRLTPEQEKLKEEYEDLMARIKASGMTLFNDSWRGIVTFVNEKNATVESRYHDDDEGWYQLDSDKLPTSSMSLAYDADDNQLFVIAKESEDNKDNE